MNLIGEIGPAGLPEDPCSVRSKREFHSEGWIAFEREGEKTWRGNAMRLLKKMIVNH
jgi:hypothetical protein